VSSERTDTTSGSVRQDADGPVPGPIISVDGAHPGPDASLSDLLGRMIDDLTLLFRQEVELAKAEVKRDVTAAGKAGGMLAAGAAAAVVAVFLLAWAAAWGLAEVVPTGVAFLIVGLVFAAAAAALVMTGKKRLEKIDPTPHETIDSLQRDARTISERSPR
jgi:hypothetical protein